MTKKRVQRMVVGWLLGVTSLLAQQGTGSLIGLVADPGGAAVPGAAVTLTNVELKDKRDLTTQSNGQFRFQALNPGTYLLQVSKSGFKGVSVDNIALLSSENRDLGIISLQIGSLSESVTVTAEATPVQTATSERAASVTSDQLETLSMKGRDPFGMLHTLPGVIDTGGSRDLTSFGSSGSISINGLGAGSATPAIDGAAVAHLAGPGSVMIIPNLDAIDEVRVVSSGSQAEFGRNSGGTINFVTKGGTSQYHGSFHWDHRNEGMNANSFFNNRSNIANPIYRYLILGGSIGGPVNIPKVTPGFLKKNVFFFYSPEYTTSKQPTNPGTVNAPTALEISGDFSKTLLPTGAVLAIIDPTTGKQFPGNVIPANRIDPTGLALLKLLPTPNGYLNPSLPYSFNAAYPATPAFSRWDHVVRIDANPRKNLNTYYRAVIDRTNTGVVNSVTQGKGAYTTFNPGTTHAAHAAWVFRPTLVIESQFSYTFLLFGSPGHTDSPDSAYYRTATLSPPQLFSFPDQTSKTPWGTQLYPAWLPTLQFGGGNYANYAGFTANANATVYQNGDHQYTFKDDVTYIHGGHSYKVGLSYEHAFDYDTPGNSNNYVGTYNFGSTAANPLDSGDGYANALLGNYQSYTQASKRLVQERHYYAVEGYVQDNWKVTKRLTIDIGLRFLHQSPTYDDTGYSAQFFPSQYSAATAPRLYWPTCKVGGRTAATCSAANQQALDLATGLTNTSPYIANFVPGVGNATDGLQAPVANGLHYPAVGWQPRVGFAWNMFGDGKTVLRGSAGMFNNRASLNNLIGQSAPPALLLPSIPFNTIGNLATQGSSVLLSPSAGNVNNEIPYDRVYQYNLTFEKDIHFNTVISIGYVGTQDRHAQGTLPQNLVPFGSYAVPGNTFVGAEVSANLLRSQYPGLGSISTYCGCVSSLNYNGLQTSLSHRLHKGLSFNANYTFSKALGTSSAGDGYHTGQPITTAYGGTITLPGVRQWFYGPTGTDRTHYGGANVTYELPSVHKLGFLGKEILSGWVISTIFSVSSGAAVSPTCTTTGTFPANDPTFTGAGGVRCQVSGDWKNFTQDFYHNFNTAAFAYPNGGTQAAPTPTFGNVGNGIMRQPTWWNQDATIYKNFALGGEKTRRTAQINFQAYNVYNHTEFSGIGTTFSFNGAGLNTNTQTGQYTATQSSRQAVITARINF